MAVYISHNAINCKSESNTNQGVFPSYSVSTIAIKGPHYYITKPFIDRISIKGTPPYLKDSEIEQINKVLYYQSKAKEEGADPDGVVSRHHFKDKRTYANSGYRYHYRITPPKSNDSVLLSFSPFEKKGKPLKVTLNPNKIGANGVSFFRDWYDAFFINDGKFEQLLFYKEAIGVLDIAIDIVGVDIKSFVLNQENAGKSCQYHSHKGGLETFYINAVPGVKSKLKVYDKTKCAHENTEELCYPSGYPVTRIEKSITTKLAVDELCNLKSTHFKDLRLFLALETKPPYPEAEYHWKIFLEASKNIGIARSLEMLPVSLSHKYYQKYNECVIDIFQEYHGKDKWQKWWRSSLLQSGLFN